MANKHKRRYATSLGKCKLKAQCNNILHPPNWQAFKSLMVYFEEFFSSGGGSVQPLGKTIVTK